MLRGGLNPLRGPLVAYRPEARLLSVQAQSQANRDGVDETNQALSPVATAVTAHQECTLLLIPHFLAQQLQLSRGVLLLALFDRADAAQVRQLSGVEPTSP